MQQPCTWRAKEKVEYMVACTVFMGGRCTCALAHVYFKSCGIKKLGQTPLICEMSLLKYNLQNAIFDFNV